MPKLIMSEIGERPSKIRKLSSPDVSHNESPLASENTPNGENGRALEENDISRMTVYEPQKEDPPMSKNQLKKLRRDEAWAAMKTQRKDKRRDKRHERQARKAVERAELQAKIANGDIEEPVISPKELAMKRQRPVQVPISLIIDCDFDELMTDKELISLGAQLTRCYSDNRHAKYRSHMILSSWEGALRTRFETTLTNNHLGWKGVRFMEKDFVGAAQEIDNVLRGRGGGQLVGALAPVTEAQTPESDEKNVGSGAVASVENQDLETEASNEKIILVALERVMEESPDPVSQPSIAPDAMDLSSNSPAIPETSTKEVEPTAAPSEPLPEPSIVYLTSDSPHTLERLSPNTSYIIGGIVDKNRHKGICYKRACERGIPTAKLPIGEFMTMQSRTVLAVNHVMEIMLKWLETGDWGEAFLSVIPKRKEAKLRVKGEATKEEEESEDDEAGGVKFELKFGDHQAGGVETEVEDGVGEASRVEADDRNDGDRAADEVKPADKVDGDEQYI